MYTALRNYYKTLIELPYDWSSPQMYSLIFQNQFTSIFAGLMLCVLISTFSTLTIQTLDLIKIYLYDFLYCYLMELPPDPITYSHSLYRNSYVRLQE
ncbi:hypothetical protein VNO77_12070 [Canavalia gladiata]|uniref:Uncharacterized protein n=1 Tax=Canavalia gladiata TaxID=3824 RepID=A0AAN9LVV0_CANGL